MRRRIKSNFIFIIFFILGLYLLNKGINLFPIENIEKIDNTIMTVSGILLILGGFKFFRIRKRRH